MQTGTVTRGRTGASARRLWAGCSAAVLVLACAGAAHGQNALGDGRALDRNLQVGSGRINTQVRDLDAQIRYNNAIVTGQAAGGRSFRGDVGYRATDEFAGRLGSDATYTFRRDSAYSAAPLMGIRTSDAIRYQFALSTGSALPPQFAGSSGSVYRDASATRGSDIETRVSPGAIGATGPVGSSAGSMRSSARFVTERAIRPSVVGYTQDGAGGQYTVTASPLLGVNLFKVAQTDVPKPGEVGGAPLLPGERRQESPQRLPVDRPVVNPLSGFEAGSSRVPSALDAFGTATVPQIDNLLRSEQLAPNTVDHQRVLDRFESAYRGRAGAEEGAGRTGQPEGMPGMPGGGPGAVPGAPAGGAGGGGGASGLTWEQQLVRTRAMLRGDDPVEALKKFEQDRARAASSRPTDPAAATTGAVAVDEEALRRENEAAERAGSRLGLSPQTVRALREAGVNFERLDGGLVQGPNRVVDQESYQRSMRAGQDLLAQGRFFDAEERFTRAIAAAPADAMAAIGRVHAQLGGGMYLSAASNLRRVITSHPELVGSTFAPELVPDAERSKRIRSQLMDVLELRRGRGNALGREAGLLLAYLGHITRDQATVRRGLDEFAGRLTETERADQALVELLRGVWLADGQAPAK